MRRQHAALERAAIDISNALRQLDTEHEIYLRACAALLADRPQIGAATFARILRDLNFEQYRQGSAGVGWAPRIAAADIGRATAQLRRETDPGFTIRRLPGADGRDAFPVEFISPRTPENLSVLGFDMYSEPLRRAAMDRAAALAAPVATGRLTLIQDSKRPGQAGFLIYMPVSQVSGGRAELRGFVYIPFRVQALLTLASRTVNRGAVAVGLYDGKPGQGQLLAWSGPTDRGSERIVIPVTIANRPWQLAVSESPRYRLSRLSQITILSGLMAAILLTALIRLTYQKIEEDRQLLEWRASAAGIRDSLTRELNHRVKNTLATVLSIITLTRRRADDLDSFVESLSGRIRALSATHDLLTSAGWASIGLREIVVAELAPYIGENGKQIVLDGPDLSLAPNDALTLGLAVHELATNAAKYGALSVLSGRITVRWAPVGQQLIELHWQEEGGPAVSEPTKRGFGRELIEKILVHELHSPVRLTFAREGLSCTFRVPLRQANPFVLRTRPRGNDPPGG